MSRSKLSESPGFKRMYDVNETSNDLNGSAIHLWLQGKGGVRKSFIASVLAQHFLSRGHRVGYKFNVRVNGDILFDRHYDAP